MAFTFFFRDSQTLELAIEEALPSLQGLRVHSRLGRRMRPRARTLHAGHPAARADVRLRVQKRSHPCHRHRFELRRQGDRGRLCRPGGQASSARNLPESISARLPGPALSRSCRNCGPRSRSRTTTCCRLRPIREGLSLIVCKNVLLHFDETQRINVLRMFHQALQPGGILVMEHTQKLPETLAARFRQVAPYAQVFRKVRRPREHRPRTTRPTTIPNGLVDIHGHRSPSPP